MAQETTSGGALAPVSSNQDAVRVPITIASGILGCIAYLVGAVFAVWSYVVNGFDASDWKFWLGYGLLAAGIGIFVWLLQWNKNPERLDPAVRRTMYGYNIFLGTMFLAALLILGNILVTQYGNLVGLKASYDWTSQGVFTLQDVSVQQAKALNKPVKIYALYQRGTQRGNQLEQLIAQYTAANKNITPEFIDIVEDRLRLEDFFKKYPDAVLRGAGGFLEPSIVLTYGEGDDAPHKVVKDSEIFKVDTREIDLQSGSRGGDRSFFGENAITSAIRFLMEDKKTAVYFTTGHGELNLNESDERSIEGIGLLKQRLTDLNIRVEPVNLIKAEVPSDANIVIIAGPKSGFDAGEVQKLRDFMDRRDSSNNRAGRLLVLFDSPKEASRGAPADANLGEFLASLQVDVKDNLVYDFESALQRADQLVVQLEPETSTHPIVSPLKNRWVLLIRAREIAPISNPHPPGMPGAPPEKFQVAKLFSSTPGPRSWAQVDYEGRPNPEAPDNSRGPVCMAVAVSEGGSPPPPQNNPFAPPPPPPTSSTPVAVVFGDATFAANNIVAQKPENEDLFLNAVNWLGGRVADIGIQPKVKKYSRLNLDNAGYYTIIFEPFFHLVAIAGFVAGLIWVIRSDRFRLLWLPILGTLLWLALYAGLAVFVIGPPSSEATRITVTRVFMTCVVLWGIGVTFWMARLQNTSTNEAV
jgi:hypothetical protein